MNGINTNAEVLITRRKKSSDKSLFDDEKLTKQEKETSYSKSKSISPLKKKTIKSDSIQFDSRMSPLTKLKKTLSWKKKWVEIVDVPSYKKFNMENTHEDLSGSQEKINCGCYVF